MTTKTTGYTLDEMIANGFYDYTLIASRPATAEEAELGCSDFEDCPCCTCDDTAIAVQTFARPRWSKSSKRMVEEILITFACSAHVE